LFDLNWLVGPYTRTAVGLVGDGYGDVAHGFLSGTVKK
jgi:hypothetical protein